MSTDTDLGTVVVTDTQEGHQGRRIPSDSASGFNEMSFLVASILSGRHHAALVEVVACTNSGAVSAPGFVNVTPMVHQLDGAGNAVPHGIVYSLPYCRLQCGASAIIADPVVGDIGLAVFADRDISKVKKTRKPASPGSHRQNSFSDGVYVCGLLNSAPTQYIRLHSGGIGIVSPTAVTINAPSITSAGDWTHTGTITATVNVIAGGKSGAHHTHTTPSGGGTTSEPD